MTPPQFATATRACDLTRLFLHSQISSADVKDMYNVIQPMLPEIAPLGKSMQAGHLVSWKTHHARVINTDVMKSYDPMPDISLDTLTVKYIHGGKSQEVGVCPVAFIWPLTRRLTRRDLGSATKGYCSVFEPWQGGCDGVASPRSSAPACDDVCLLGPRLPRHCLSPDASRLFQRKK